MASNTSVLEAIKLPTKINMWLAIVVSMIVIANTAAAIEKRYTKQEEFTEFAVFTKVSFAELHLEMTQERINRIKAIPDMEREGWQREEMLRLESIKEKQLRRLNGERK